MHISVPIPTQQMGTRLSKVSTYHTVNTRIREKMCSVKKCNAAIDSSQQAYSREQNNKRGLSEAKEKPGADAGEAKEKSKEARQESKEAEDFRQP